MTDEEARRWAIGGPDAQRIPKGTKALAEHLLSESGGDAVAALVDACCIIGAMRWAVSRGMIRRGSVHGAELGEALDAIARGERAGLADGESVHCRP